MLRKHAHLLYFAIVMHGAIALAIGSDLTKGLCYGVNLQALNEGRPVFGCFEFWLSRYQTAWAGALGAAAALFAAGIAWRAVQRQIDEQRFVLRKVANLRIYSELEECRRALITMIETIDNNGQPLAAGIDRLPVPGILNDMSDLVPLSEADTTDLFNLCRDMDRESFEARDIAEILAFSPAEYLQIAAAAYVPRVQELRNRFAGYLGWEQKPAPSHPPLPQYQAEHRQYLFARAELFPSR